MAKKAKEVLSELADTYNVEISLKNDGSRGFVFNYTYDVSKEIPREQAEEDLRHMVIRMVDKCVEEYIKPRLTLTINRNGKDFLPECHPYAQEGNGRPVTLPRSIIEGPLTDSYLLGRILDITNTHPTFAGYLRADIERLVEEQNASSGNH